MEQYREKVTRGTPDFPFAHYQISRRQISAEFRHVHWHPEMEILYMRQSRAEVRTGKDFFQLHPGDIAFIHPGELHDIRPLDTDSEHEAFVFSMDLITLPQTHFFQRSVIEPIKTGIARLPRCVTPGSECHRLANPAVQRIRTAFQGDPHYKLTVFTALMEIFTALSTSLTAVSEINDTRNETVKACIRYMDENYSTQLTLSDIANQVHLHPNYLCDLFRSYTGQTVFEYLIRLRIEKAARLLRSTDISVTQAAVQCGFETPGFFSRKFKALMGITPKQYSIRFSKGTEKSI